MPTEAALRFRWISEGGLKPVFKNEGTTWVEICMQSVVLSWEEVIRSLDCEDEYKQALTDFYTQAKEEMNKVNSKLKDD